MKEENTRALFSKGGALLGIRFSPLQLDQLMVYLRELLRWNKKMNLTGLQEEREVVINLFLDSLTPLLFLKPDKHSQWIDVGTGAGFPGLVLKIACPELNITLLEPTQKKVSFLHHLIGQFGLSGVSVINARLENLSRSKEGKPYDLLLSRALSPKIVLEQGAGLVMRGGHFLLFLGRLELKRLNDLLANVPFLVLDQIRPVLLPFSGVSRSLLFLRVLS